MKKLFCVLAQFDSPKSLYHAAEKVRDSKYTHFDVYTPFPVHGMDQAMGIKPSKLPWIVLVGGAIGLSVGFGLQTWVATTAYPLIIGGKPFFSFQAFVPVTFELMVLFSGISTVFGMFALNKLPKHSHPLLRNDSFRTATSHGFFLGIESTDPAFDADSVTSFLRETGATSVEKVEG